MKKHIVLAAAVCMAALHLCAQAPVTGSLISDRTKDPVRGATVRSLATGATAKTNGSGHFSIKLKSFPDSLRFTHIGYITQTVVIAHPGQVVLAALTEREEEMEQVFVNTGYQKLKPNEINGSVTVIDNKMLNEQTGTNILQRLKGITNGLVFNSGKVGAEGGNNDISIRGLSTINGPLAPLIILDNFPYEENIDNINPNDVESVTILKDAAAASIWGARAGNGVIVITTKRGKYNDRLRINLNSSYLFTRPVDLYSAKQMPVADYITLEQGLFDKGYFNETIDNTATRPALSPLVEVLVKRREGKLSDAEAATQIEALKQYDSREQYARYFQRTGLTQQHSLSVSGGSGQFSWRLAGNYNHVVGADRSLFDKINVHLDNRIRPVKNLEVALTAYYTNSSSKGGLPSFNSVTSINRRHVPYLRFMDDNGQSIPIDQYRRGYTDTAGGGRLQSWDYYPLEEYEHNNTTRVVQDMILRASVDYKIYKGLSFNVDYQYQKQWSKSRALADTVSFYTRDLINRFTSLPANPALPPVYNVPQGAILDLANGALITKNLRGQLNFSQHWGQHSITAIFGSEMREALTESGDALTIYGYQEDPLSQVRVNYTAAFPNYITGSPERIPSREGVTAYYITRFVSTYANGSYTFARRYTLSGSFRKDAANVFGLKTNDKWNPLWSSGIGWLLSGESFYKVSALPYLKLRVTYGYSGNLDTRKTPLPISGVGNDPTTGFMVQRISSLNNPSLRWEKSGQTNFGIDFRLEQDVVSGSLEYYQKKGTNLYGPSPLDYTTWGLSRYIVKNVADMKGHGVDVSITTKNLNGKVKWKTIWIYNYNTSKTTRYYSDQAKDFYTANDDGNRINPVIGRPLYSLTAYRWGGLDAKGDPQGYLDGKLSTDYKAIYSAAAAKGLQSGGLKYVGSTVPLHFGSVTNFLEWRQLQLSFNLMYKAGYYFKKGTFTSAEVIMGGMGRADYALRWQQPGDEAHTTVPAFVYTDYLQFNERDGFYMNAEPNVVRGDHIRLNYVNLAYEARLKNKTGTVLRIYANAANLWILWRANKYKLDPDAPYGDPAARQYTVGVNVDF
ncbi:SusC/RagA family TonB-linked outer membrane protein [Niabella aurantiaca]|uniref:SusC/RagA family TonB-linked outer membrane protein n=1 Tax=Niabella aurantiaca TaxID=379900 RepID=UPI000371EE40|nr:SusC/RagA family TonB-linked outer membrane protein [Niabella aurantiaca]